MVFVCMCVHSSMGNLRQFLSKVVFNNICTLLQLYLLQDPPPPPKDVCVSEGGKKIIYIKRWVKNKKKREKTTVNTEQIMCKIHKYKYISNERMYISAFMRACEYAKNYKRKSRKACPSSTPTPHTLEHVLNTWIHQGRCFVFKVSQIRCRLLRVKEQKVGRNGSGEATMVLEVKDTEI